MALSHEGRDVTFGEFAQKLAATATATGGALTAEALVPVVLNTLIPGVLPALGADGFAELVRSVLAAADEITGGGALTWALRLLSVRPG